MQQNNVHFVRIICLFDRAPRNTLKDCARLNELFYCILLYSTVLYSKTSFVILQQQYGAVIQYELYSLSFNLTRIFFAGGGGAVCASIGVYFATSGADNKRLRTKQEPKRQCCTCSRETYAVHFALLFCSITANESRLVTRNSLPL